MAFVDLFADMMPHTVSVQAVTIDHMGDETASGSPTTPACRIEGGPRLVRDTNGQETVSSHQLIVAATGLTVDDHRYTLPAGYDPRGNEGSGLGLKAIRVDSEDDESGHDHSVVYLP